jgi:hypothetical protein
MSPAASGECMQEEAKQNLLMDEKSKMVEQYSLPWIAIEVEEESKLTFFFCSDDRRRDESLRLKLLDASME